MEFNLFIFNFIINDLVILVQWVWVTKIVSKKIMVYVLKFSHQVDESVTRVSIEPEKCKKQPDKESQDFVVIYITGKNSIFIIFRLS